MASRRDAAAEKLTGFTRDLPCFLMAPQLSALTDASIEIDGYQGVRIQRKGRLADSSLGFSNSWLNMFSGVLPLANLV